MKLRKKVKVGEIIPRGVESSPGMEQQIFLFFNGKGGKTNLPKKKKNNKLMRIARSNKSITFNKSLRNGSLGNWNQHNKWFIRIQWDKKRWAIAQIKTIAVNTLSDTRSHSVVVRLYFYRHTTHTAGKIEVCESAKKSNRASTVCLRQKREEDRRCVTVTKSLHTDYSRVHERDQNPHRAAVPFFW